MTCTIVLVWLLSHGGTHTERYHGETCSWPAAQHIAARRKAGMRRDDVLLRLMLKRTSHRKD